MKLSNCSAKVVDFPTSAAVLEPQKGLTHKNKFTAKLDKRLSDVMKEMRISLSDLSIVLNTRIGEMFIVDNYLPTRCVTQWRHLVRIWYGPDSSDKRIIKRLMFEKEYQTISVFLIVQTKFTKMNFENISEMFSLS